MNRSELLRSALRALRAHKLRSFLTLLGVIIGVTTIVAVVGIISGLDTFVKEKIIVFAPDVYAVSKMTPSTSMEEFIRQLRRPPITWQEYERVAGAGLPNTATVGMAIGKPMTPNPRNATFAMWRTFSCLRSTRATGRALNRLSSVGAVLVWHLAIAFPFAASAS